MRITVTKTETGLQIRLHGESGQFEVALGAMKQEIPRSYRRFDGEQRCWVVDHICQSKLENWLGRMQREINASVVYKKQTPLPGPLVPLTNAYATLHLLPTAPPELIKAAYRCLALMNHPDRGGNTESMQQINSAYAQLSARGA